MPKFKLLAIVTLIVVSAASLYFLGPYLNFATVKEYQGQILQVYEGHKIESIVGYFLVYVALTALSVPIASALSLIAGVVMGVGYGAAVVSFAATFGSLLAFWLVRYLVRGAFTKRHDEWLEGRLGKYKAQAEAVKKGVREEGRFYLFALRLNPIVPFFIVNMAMGLTDISAFDFFWVSWVGMLPGTWLYVNAGAKIGAIGAASDILSLKTIVSLAALGLFPLLMKKLARFGNF